MRKRIRNTLLFGISMLPISACQAQEEIEQTLISKNGMKVRWHFQDNRIHFEMSAPTRGWVTIGFNTNQGMAKSYLLMGRVVENKAQVVEYYTIASGYYKPIEALGGQIQIQDVSGFQKTNKSMLRFSLPIKPAGKYQKDLSPGRQYIMVLAYSQDDDFQHHSMMRTSIKVEL